MHVIYVQLTNVTVTVFSVLFYYNKVKPQLFIIPYYTLTFKRKNKTKYN